MARDRPPDRDLRHQRIATSPGCRAHEPAAAGLFANAPAETQSNPYGSEGFVDDLLDPVGRARRAEALKAFAADEPQDPRGSRPRTKPTYRRGMVLAAVTEVLVAASGPMQARAIHLATKELTGEAVGWSSVKNCLAEHLGGGRLASSAWTRALSHGTRLRCLTCAIG